MKPGIYPGISYDEYDSWEGIRKSRLWTLHQRTPAHYRAELGAPLDSPAFAFGRAFHSAVLEPERYAEDYAIGGPMNPRTGKVYGTDSNKFKEWAEEHGGQVVSATDDDTIRDMRTTVLAHRSARMILESSAREVSLAWVDEETGLPCKGRLDLWNDAGFIFADLKSAENASEWAFGKSAYRFGYHFQAAFYFDGLRQILGVDLDPERNPPHFIVVEKALPYAVAVYRVGPLELELGRSQYRPALETLKACMDRDRWPAYDEGILDLSLPSWAGEE